MSQRIYRTWDKKRWWWTSIWDMTVCSVGESGIFSRPCCSFAPGRSGDCLHCLWQSCTRAVQVSTTSAHPRCMFLGIQMSHALSWIQVVFPKLVSTGLKWTFTGELEARQLLISRNCVPVLADPSLGGVVEVESAHIEGSMLNRAIAYAYSKEWIRLGSRVVVSQHAKKNTDWSFEEAGVVKILSVENEVFHKYYQLTINCFLLWGFGCCHWDVQCSQWIHSDTEEKDVCSCSHTNIQRYSISNSNVLKIRDNVIGTPVNEMPVTIPKRSPHLFASIPEQESREDVEDDEDEAYEVSAVPGTPDESALNQVRSALNY